MYLLGSVYHFEPIFSHVQLGFRKRRSCVLQLLVTLQTIYKSLEEVKQVNMEYTDYEKAFDHVDHGLLLQKLHESSGRGKLLPEIISNQSSTTCQSQPSLFRLRQRNKWCPASSILSSLLFHIYTKDMR